MRRIYILLLLILACCPMMLHAENETSYLPLIGIRQGGAHGRADDVRRFEQGENPYAAHRSTDTRTHVGGQ